MPGLLPGIHVLIAEHSEDVDGRDKPGHDESISKINVGWYNAAYRLPTWQVYEAALGAASLARAAETGIDPAGICRAAAEFRTAAARQTVRVAAFARRPCTVGADRSQSGRQHREGQEGLEACHHCQLLFPGRA